MAVAAWVVGCVPRSLFAALDDFCGVKDLNPVIHVLSAILENRFIHSAAFTLLVRICGPGTLPAPATQRGPGREFRGLAESGLQHSSKELPLFLRQIF